MKKYIRSDSVADNSLAQDVANILRTTDNIIADFNANEEFNPYDALTDNEGMSQKLYSASVNFQAEIQAAVDKFRDATTWSARLNP